ncbi:glucose-methanol-choline oxidoreductase, partial [Byssothecium circinans]
HPAGTCEMGKTDDIEADADARLQVRGIEGLRVADASIIPTLMSGHPQMAVYAIGEKAVNLLLGA